MSSLIRYKLANKSLGSIRAQVNSSVISFDYPCDNESFCSPIYINLSPGRFKIEVWGAQGGSKGSVKGGRGGYSSGVVSINQPTSFYLFIGGTQTFNDAIIVQPGGYNGGGNGSSNHTSYVGCGGGGGTDLRLRRDDLYSRIIVAGGGGGCGKERYPPGVGGGIEGSNGTVDESGRNCANEGGKQDRRGRTRLNEDPNEYKYLDQIEFIYSGFGYGGSWIWTDGTGWPSGGGGGGWFGGGNGCVYGGSGAGGSGYVFSSSSIRFPSMQIPSRLQFSEAILESGSSINGNEGNGHARFTIIEEFPEYKCMKTCRAYRQAFVLYIYLQIFVNSSSMK